ncbi:hypothetical protein O6H91_13G033700 [Diphasiastrum complanatum]|uniref:Uncharacterized protein n=1 Tax=Diphasiastrum complanatum TaxID=34168 RepID=A0ACC2BTZ5_DIPCM|nr:hypothetical protein O6H91_13G033700 [Diphasiastrum complanatum]
MAHHEQFSHAHHHHRRCSPTSSDHPHTVISTSTSTSRHAAAPPSRSSPFIPASSTSLRFPSHAAARSAARKSRSDISEDERQEIRMAFELFDTRKTGKLSYRDVKVAMRAFGFEVKKAEVRKLIEDHTRDGTEKVDLDEFMDIMTVKYREKDPDEELAKAFTYFDEDGTGKITLKNLRKIARELGEHITDEELAAMIDECFAVDKDGDGEIDEGEFMAIMKRDEDELDD